MLMVFLANEGLQQVDLGRADMSVCLKITTWTFEDFGRPQLPVDMTTRAARHARTMLLEIQYNLSTGLGLHPETTVERAVFLKPHGSFSYLTA